jgi:hypothetical protein
MVAADALGIVETFAACYSAIHVLEEVLCTAYKFTPEDISREFLEDNERLFLVSEENEAKAFNTSFLQRLCYFALWVVQHPPKFFQITLSIGTEPSLH